MGREHALAAPLRASGGADLPHRPPPARLCEAVCAEIKVSQGSSSAPQLHILPFFLQAPVEKFKVSGCAMKNKVGPVRFNGL